MRCTRLVVVAVAGLMLAAAPGSVAQARRVAQLRARVPRGDARFTMVVTHPRDPDVLLVGTSVGMVLRSEDGGLTWDRIRLLPSEQPSLVVEEPSVEAELPEAGAGEDDDEHGGGEAPDPFGALLHPDTAGHVVEDLTFCEPEPDTAFATTAAGVFRSHDAGRTWAPLQSLDAISGTLWIECDETVAGHVVVATDAGAWETLDDGETWRLVRVFAHNAVSYVYPDGPGRLVAASSLGVYSGQPPETLETVVYGDTPAGDLSRDALHFALTDGPTAYIGMRGGAVVTRDGGRTWARVAELTLGRLEVWLILVDPRDERHAYFLVSEPGQEQPDARFASPAGWVFETRDAGETVEVLHASVSARSVSGMELDPVDPDRLWLLTDTALFLVAEPDPAAGFPSGPLAVRAALALRRDPGLEQVMGAALRRSRLRAEDEDALRRSLARAAWAPVVSLGVDVGIDSPERRMAGLGPLRWEPDFRLRGDPRVTQLLLVDSHAHLPTTTNPYSTVYDAPGLAITMGVTLTWSLDRAVVDERQAASGWLEVRRVRRQVQTAVLDTWVERRRLLGELAMRPLEPLGAERTALRIEELTALLDALTGGVYGGSLGERTRGRRSAR